MVVKSKPLTDDAYVRVRDLIVSGGLRPGQKLVDRDLADQLSVSRTPVREALARLAMMGLVEARSRRGYYVTQFKSEQISELYEFRKILEVAAAGLAAQNAKPEHQRKLKRILIALEGMTGRPDSSAQTVVLDLQIHNVIAEASGNVLLEQAIQNLIDKVTAFIWVDWANYSMIGDSAQIAAAQSEHKALILSIMEKDAKRAARLMSSHIDNARRGLEQMLHAQADMRSSFCRADHYRHSAGNARRPRRR